MGFEKRIFKQWNEYKMLRKTEEWPVFDWDINTWQTYKKKLCEHFPEEASLPQQFFSRDKTLSEFTNA